MTTGLDISLIIPAQRKSTMTDTESTADDARRLHLMEEMLRDRGYQSTRLSESRRDRG